MLNGNANSLTERGKGRELESERRNEEERDKERGGEEVQR